jgi:hypothetical protein
MRTLALLVTLFLFSACTLPTPPTPRPAPVSDLQAVIGGAVAYLEGEYDTEIGLIRESPITAPDRYWLATDNQLAVYALAAVDNDLAATLADTIARYQESPHGLIEALTGEQVEWPPRVETQAQVEGKIWHEHRLSGGQYDDWQAYADLALYGALAAHNRGETEEASATERH